MPPMEYKDMPESLNPSYAEDNSPLHRNWSSTTPKTGGLAAFTMLYVMLLVLNLPFAIENDFYRM